MKKLCVGVVAALSLTAITLSQAQPVGTPVQGPANGMTKVTLHIKAPAAVIQHQKAMNKPNEITIGERTFKLPPGVEQVTVVHNLGHVEMLAGKPVTVRVAYNNTDCKIEISGRPMQSPNRLITLTIGERKMGNEVQGYCEKAVISGVQ